LTSFSYLTSFYPSTWLVGIGAVKYADLLPEHRASLGTALLIGWEKGLAMSGGGGHILRHLKRFILWLM